jgi:hypothetical protein
MVEKLPYWIVMFGPFLIPAVVMHRKGSILAGLWIGLKGLFLFFLVVVAATVWNIVLDRGFSPIAFFIALLLGIVWANYKAAIAPAETKNQSEKRSEASERS